jgi:hypothetical protein
MPTSPAISRTYTTTVRPDPDGSTMTALGVPFDPKTVFGKARAPVIVAVGQHTFRSTICNMGDGHFIPLRASNREPAGVRAGQRVQVTLTLDDKPRTITPPTDLAKALRAAGLLSTFKSLAFTHQREHVEAIEQAKKPETRANRIAKCVEMVKAKAAKVKAKPKARKSTTSR